ncbi:RNA-binding protein 12 [Folsomia candida]|uniref:RNA-binding protein 12 n=1 Tax=Folsomia candida TaxID=158441 RepID=A0A226DBH2_FOLCA|nr:RNA-binding protein 12 [Folsomia candida]
MNTIFAQNFVIDTVKNTQKKWVCNLLNCRIACKALLPYFIKFETHDYPDYTWVLLKFATPKPQYPKNPGYYTLPNSPNTPKTRAPIPQKPGVLYPAQTAPIPKKPGVLYPAQTAPIPQKPGVLYPAQTTPKRQGEVEKYIVDKKENTRKEIVAIKSSSNERMHQRDCNVRLEMLKVLVENKLDPMSMLPANEQNKQISR